MFDFRLKVFYTVARRLNFTKAAQELYITQPSVTKHIKEIENYYQTKLFDRNGTKIKLTKAGTILFRHTEQLFKIYRNIDLDLDSLKHDNKGTLHLGVSTTIAQYVLPSYLAAFKEQFPDISIKLTTQNTDNIEALLLDHKIDMGIIEGYSKRRNLNYLAFAKDEIVLCTHINNNLVKTSSITLNSIGKLPLITREQGSGTLEVIHNALSKANFNLSHLNIELVLESTESIKNYLLNSKAFAFLSIHSIYKELLNKEMKIIDIKDFEIERHFYLVNEQGQTETLPLIFQRFLLTHSQR
ncbi:LysR substrate-binding domain-containing protein [Pedobacter sp.]|uniref:LysR substrate-binding domain-containing protein n=1 Tax=Pedobacter sp. TaxID=1411316 RepID=UPI00396C3249